MAYLRLKQYNLSQHTNREVRQQIEEQRHQRYIPEFARGTWHLKDRVKNHAAVWAPGEVMYFYTMEEARAAAHDFNVMDADPVIFY